MLLRLALFAMLTMDSAMGLRLVGPVAWSRHTLAPAASRAAPPPLLQEGAPEKAEEIVLSDDTIVKAAVAADTSSWPEGKPKPATPEDTSVGPSEGFDPRVILYVSLPALVLIGQLFFTFSRDTLGDAALGPAVMDLWVPP